jgi:hypothetical protein
MTDHGDAREHAGGPYRDLAPAIYRICERAHETEDAGHEPEQTEELEHQLQRRLGRHKEQHADDDGRDALDEDQPPGEQSGLLDAALRLQRPVRGHRGTSGLWSFHPVFDGAHPQP